MAWKQALCPVRVSDMGIVLLPDTAHNALCEAAARPEFISNAMTRNARTKTVALFLIQRCLACDVSAWRGKNFESAYRLDPAKSSQISGGCLGRQEGCMTSHCWSKERSAVRNYAEQ